MNQNDPIVCPVCEKGKFYAISRPTGVISVRCDKCHKPVEINWDTHKANIGSTIKYAKNIRWPSIGATVVSYQPTGTESIKAFSFSRFRPFFFVQRNFPIFLI